METIIATGNYLNLLSKDHWEFVRRTNNSGIVVIVALTPERKVLLVEQHRPPVGSSVIELPAGLAGDIPGQEDEDLSVAALRELEEETGYTATSMTQVAYGPISAGLTDETITLFLAKGLSRIGPGGGDESEDITIHEVPLDQIDSWLKAQPDRGCLIDPKIYAGLYFLSPNT
jgi:ADP-ribose pyrophosphatase